MNGSRDKALNERRRYVNSFNATMVKIWLEQIAALGVVDTGALYRSVISLGVAADGKYTDVRFTHKFKMYGLYVDFGVGSNTPLGNPGDIGRDNPRVRRRWFSRKYYASMMNIREFFAENLGKDMADVVSNAISRSFAMRFT